MEKKTCRISGKEFVVTDEEKKFYQQIDVPVPDICPDESMRQLMAIRNEWKLFRRKCDKTGDVIISAYGEGTPFPVWKNEIWWGDSWDATDYGRDFDFNRAFFEQFRELQNIVPREGTSVFRSENCAYNGHIRDSKNCYLNSLVADCEDTHYSYWVVKNKDVLDCVMTNYSELCYDCIDIDHCYDCVCSQELANCQNCYFSFQLRGCKNCIGCSNLYQKEYYIFNKKVSKEEFREMKKKIFDGSIKMFREGQKFLDKMRKSSFHKCVNNLNSENVAGDHMHSSKDCVNCFDGHGNEDCKDSISLDQSNDVYRCYSAGWPKCELVYSSAVSRGSTNLAFCYYTFFSQNLRYCDSSNYSNDCFGCVGIKHKKYCILNKQYTEEAYKKLVPKIIEHMKKTGEWGKIFPPSCITFAYNDSVAGQYFPLEKKEVEERGYVWREDEPSSKYIGPDYEVPENISDVTDSILDEIIHCEESNIPYRIQKAELEFYRKMNLPIPRFHPDVRHRHRIELRNPRKLWERECKECKKKIQTTFAPERPEKILCEECYLTHVQ